MPLIPAARILWGQIPAWLKFGAVGLALQAGLIMWAVQHGRNLERADAEARRIENIKQAQELDNEIENLPDDDLGDVIDGLLGPR